MLEERERMGDREEVNECVCLSVCLHMHRTFLEELTIN